MRCKRKKDYDYEQAHIIVDTISDCGVTFNSNINFNTYANKIVTKASQLLGFICMNSKDFKDVNTLK